VLTFSGTILSFLLAIVLARVLGAERYGVYVYVFALVSMLAIPAQSGLTSLVARETAKAVALERWGLMWGIWRWATRTAVFYWVLLVLLVGAFVHAFAVRFTGAQLDAFFWGLLLGFFVVLEDIRAGASFGIARVATGQLPEMIFRRALLITFVLGVALLYPTYKLTAANVVALHALGEALALALGVGMLWKACPASPTSSQVSAHERRQWRKAVLPLALPSGVQLTSQNIGILLLGVFSGAADVGIYRITLRGTMLVVFGLLATNWVVAPHFARLHAAGETLRIKHLAIWSARASFAVGILVVLVFAIGGGKILGFVFGQEFARGYVALVIVGCGQLVNTAVGPLDFLLNMTGHERATATSAAGALACNVIFSLILIPKLGINGAALAMALALLVWDVALFVSVRRLLGIDCCAFLKIDSSITSPNGSGFSLKIQNP